ncbi:serine protease [Rhodococcus sp. IEGM 1354]|uniref:serine protease n=1 Tax=Rhodococcus sp. IEGM 1354 TaxID=3047088 RepID=UPI0024B875CB|nr:serine protease [Rhodococcus sp. IEGM 1354]MDI9929227.1 serine protease [Rhodococcus sp. IEGM 1354]
MFKKFMLVVVGAAAIVASVGVGTASAAAPAALGGGSGIIVGGQAECTLTTIGNDRNGNLVGFTAGHCGRAGDSIVPEYDTSLGEVGTIAFSNPEYDYALIQFQRDRVAPISRVGNVTISQVGPPTAFPNIVCKEGRTTGNTCGLAYGDILQSQETWAQLCVVEGDSGSPVVVGNTLVGMVNAYLGVACFGPEVGTNFDAILRNVDQGNGLGAGFVPAP